MTSFATGGMPAEDLPSLTLFLSAAALWTTRSRRFARPTRPAATTLAPQVLVALATVLFADCFRAYRIAFRGLFLPKMFPNSGANEETHLLPNFLAAGELYFFINGIATRPIRMANTHAARTKLSRWSVNSRLLMLLSNLEVIVCIHLRQKQQ